MCTGIVLEAEGLSGAKFLLPQRTRDGRVLLCMGCFFCIPLKWQKQWEILICIPFYHYFQARAGLLLYLNEYDMKVLELQHSFFRGLEGLGIVTDVHVWCTPAQMNILQQVNNSVGIRWHSKTILHSWSSIWNLSL